MRDEPILVPLYRVEFDAAELMKAHPPVWRNKNKKVVFQLACPPSRPAKGTITVTRWPDVELPSALRLDSSPRVVASAGLFDYQPILPEPAAEWHLNFAAGELFCAYSGGLFAQDEMQVAEHPALGSVREALLARGLSTTVNDGKRSTPILVRGVERRCAIATDPNPKEGRPNGLYGNRFAEASVEAVRRAVRVLDPPTVSNILAIEAPSYGDGAYTDEEIARILRTAYGGFLAAKAESRAVDPDALVAVHTGFWGCGAYGGNRTLMAMLQLLAARMAGLDLLAFHAVDQAGLETFRRAEKLLARVLPKGHGPVPTSALVRAIGSLGLQWGVSDGN
ncbi:MAG: hypothetical protein ACK41F_11455 [Fimbriimonadaceae bacterium]